MNRNSRKAVRLVNRNLDKIYSTSVAVSKSLKFKMIHITILYEMIQKSKLKDEPGIPEEFVKNYNILLDELFNACKEHATKSKLIHPDVLKYSITVIKKSI